MRSFVSHKQASQLLHNKFVVVLGDSNQRAIYKDLVLLLQKDKFLTLKQLRTKGEMSFEQDCLVEGGCLNKLHNGIAYREVRQFQSDHHLVRFYFLTRIFSRYMESVLEDFRQGLKPDVVIINSCVWDISRYSRNWIGDYKENLHTFFEELKAILPEETLVIWNLTLPLGEKIKGGFLVPEIQHMAPQLRFDVIEANFFSGTLADAYNLDVVDLHFHFRFSLHRRTNDGVHWDNVAHRRITSVLLQHAADAWGVVLMSPLDASDSFLNRLLSFHCMDTSVCSRALTQTVIELHLEHKSCMKASLRIFNLRHLWQICAQRGFTTATTGRSSSLIPRVTATSSATQDHGLIPPCTDVSPSLLHHPPHITGFPMKTGLLQAVRFPPRLSFIPYPHGLSLIIMKVTI
uniref:Family with sequence similarity 113 n=1 Tax=Salarias fasciatus TaxID=181472 RepID=A0A672H2H1_SALFA